MKLTVKEESFVQGLFRGLSQRKAYKEAYNTDRMKDETIDVKACNLAKTDKVRIRLTELQDKVANDNQWTIEKLIKEFVEVKEMCKALEPILDRDGESTGMCKFDSTGTIKSLENIGKLCGFYEDKLKHSGEIATTINIVPAKKRDKK